MSDEKDWVKIKARDIKIGMVLCVIGTPTVIFKYKDYNGIVEVLTDDGLRRWFPQDHVIGREKEASIMDNKATPLKIAVGVLTWNRHERVSNRYGFVAVTDRDSREEKLTAISPVVFRDAFPEVGRKVRMICKVLEACDSSHIGDVFLGIFPSRPEIEEIIDFGVGRFVCEADNAYAGGVMFGLKPSDGRDELWIDPRKLYRAHEQTVEVWAVETNEDEAPVADLKCGDTEDAISNGDGTFQTKYKPIDKTFGISPDIERVGDGMFLVKPQECGEKGKRIKVTTK